MSFRDIFGGAPIAEDSVEFGIETDESFRKRIIQAAVGIVPYPVVGVQKASGAELDRLGAKVRLVRNAPCMW